MITIYKVLV